MNFVAKVEETSTLLTQSFEVLQLNIGYKCNLACTHCHLECGPHRTEEMSRETMEKALSLFERNGFSVLDITGGSVEMNPHLEWLLREAHRRDIPTMVRTNLVILLEPAYAHLPEVYSELGVEIIASLPCYTKQNVDGTRGLGAFDASIQALKRLNGLGYGTDEGHKLDLVYNPGSASLPGRQAGLEKDYKQHLADDHGIVFNNLFVIANNPAGRFARSLEHDHATRAYLDLLVANFNPDTLPGLMCKHQISVAWDGTLYDCDFNQAMKLPIEGDCHLDDYRDELLTQRAIQVGPHCFACTAGAGSSCMGETSPAN